MCVYAAYPSPKRQQEATAGIQAPGQPYDDRAARRHPAAIVGILLGPVPGQGPSTRFGSLALHTDGPTLNVLKLHQHVNKD